ncbi:carboxymuconolactone decarboxylase family protein [Uliginosibacterium sp. sgz301328]|uniref:carboxymuconolactone decarboxylase family protein n=1 Tax=Uliginosibacterium sp. sgz301328 TaxID=3243764 RepID=UPI00359E70A6
MEALNAIKELIPDYAKDVRLSIDGVIARSSLPANEAVGAALAAAFAAKNTTLVKIFRESGLLAPEEVQAAQTAASIMGMTNAWYSYLDMAADADLKTQQAGLRMNAYSTHGGVDQRRFELWALSASIVGKCKFCIAAHADVLRKVGLGTVELKDVGRIASVVNAVAQIFAAEGHH